MFVRPRIGPSLNLCFTSGLRHRLGASHINFLLPPPTVEADRDSGLANQAGCRGVLRRLPVSQDTHASEDYPR